MKHLAKNLHLRISLLVLSLALGSGGIEAQTTFIAKASKTVGTSDMLQIDFVIDGVTGVEQFVPPSFSPFQVAQGPSTMTGINMVNGVTTKSYTITYILKPPAVGKYTIAPASVRINNQDIRSNAVNVEVVKGSTGAGTSQGANPFGGGNPFAGMGGMDPMAGPGRDGSADQFLHKNDRAEDKIRRNMVLKMSVNKTSVYVGEPIVATCKLYSRLESESKVEERPSFSGFSVFEMVQPEQGNVSQEMYGGRPFNAYLIRKSQLYPLRSGDLSIEPVILDNTITFYREGKSNRSAAPSGSIFDQMMRDFWGEGQNAGVPEKHQLNLKTDSLIIHVKPLPEAGKPADFSGAVGQFTLQSSLTGISLKTNESDTLVLVVSGKGNLPMVNAPALHLPGGLESYDPSAKEELNQTISPIQGRKTFQYVFTATKKGDYTLPSIVFSYFDPQTATYKTDSTAPMLLKVLQGKESPGASVPVDGQTAPSGNWNWVWWVIAGVVLIGLGWVLVRARRRNAPAAAVEKIATPGTPGRPGTSGRPETPGTSAPTAPPETAVPVATDPHARYRPGFEDKLQHLPGAAVTTFEEKDWLEDARVQLRAQDSVAYYRALNKGLWQFLQEHLALNGSDRNKTTVLERLEAKGFSPAVREEVRQLLEECELALYAPVQTSSDMQRSFEVAERIQKRVTHNLKD